MSLEEHIRREAYSSGQADGKLARAAAVRRANRRTREERRARKKRLVLALVLLTVVSLTMLLTPTARAAEGDILKAVAAAEAAA